MNFLKAKNIHFTGVLGVGMAALALAAKDMGKKVSGSDTDEVFPTNKILKKNRIKIRTGFTPKNLPKNCDLVVYTGAHHGSNNQEVIAAKNRSITTINYAQALSQISEGKDLIATAGVGGKSSTAAMIATILTSAGLKPSYAVGVGAMSPLGEPGKYNKKGRWFVAESDEFVADPVSDPTPKFHYLKPTVAVITNLEHDHPDIYPTINDVYQSFTKFVAGVSPKGTIIVNIDNPHIQTWIKTLDRPVLKYGFSPQADWQITRSHVAAAKQLFSVRYKNMAFNDLVLNVPGEFNLLNATAAIAAANFIGVGQDKIREGVKQFLGTKRRFELIAEANKISLYDDYAHHPVEISAVIKAARTWLPRRRLIVIFQSHTYSRTKALLPQFVDSLIAADFVLINDIFASARETETLGMSGEVLTQKIREKKLQVYYAPGRAATLERLKKIIRPGDVIMTLGAGNNWLWHNDIIKLMKQL
jgi:UDP-N-acetylmuramate--alanine ligase